MGLLPTDPKERKLYLLGLRIAGDFGAIIAVPVVILVWIGQKLDAHFSVSPWCTVIAFAVSALTSGFLINKKAKVYGKIYTSLIGEDKKNAKEDKNV